MKRLLQLSIGQLTRVTSSGRFVPELDGMRFIAIALVIAHHYLYIMRSDMPGPWADDAFVATISRFCEAGNVGVPLFFIISGFILGLPFAEQHLRGGKPVSIGSYFKRRLSRLEPPYIVNLLILLGLAVAANGLPKLIERFPHFLASLTYTHTLIYDIWSEINFVAWSLEIEAQFYISAPLLATAYLIRPPRVRRLVLTTVILVTALTGGLLADASYRFSHSIAAYIEYFLAGFLLADLRAMGALQRHPTRPYIFDALAIIGFAAGLAIWSVARAGDAVIMHLAVFPLALGVYGGFRGAIVSAMLRQPAIYIYGGMCYTVYLYHFWIMRVVMKPLLSYEGTVGAPLLLAGLVYVLLIVGVLCAPLFLLFEKPFMRRTWPRDLLALLRGRRGKPSPTTPNAESEADALR